jgi:uncharacterized protein (TIGR02145 family)
MRTKRTNWFCILTFILTLVILSASCKKEGIPVLTTSIASSITPVTAISGGTIISNSNSTITQQGVCWSTALDPTIADSKTNDTIGIHVFSSYLTGLSPYTVYFVRAYATNGSGTGYGNNMSFITLTLTKPVLTTAVVTAITETTASCGGIIFSDGGASVVARGVCWSTSQYPTITNSKTIDGTGTGTFTSKLTGLTSGMLYYVRAYSTNSAGTSYGDMVNFTASPNATLITTSPVSNISSTSALSGGSITSDGGANITAKGVCFNTSPNPTTLNRVVPAGTGAGSFTSSLTGLLPMTTYYIRAFATNIEGTTYGQQVSFTTLALNVNILFNPNLTYGILKDIDNNSYKTIQIGTQIWMAENLKTTHYNDGVSIPLVADAIAWTSLITPGYCWYNNDSTTMKATFGAIYNWYTVNTGKLCPSGWHIPSDAEWTTMTTWLGGEDVTGGKLKETGIIHWVSPNAGATNESGFTALPGGGRSNYGSFDFIGNYGYWWCSTENDISSAWCRNLYYSMNKIFRYSFFYKPFGFYVRCLKD